MRMPGVLGGSSARDAAWLRWAAVAVVFILAAVVPRQLAASFSSRPILVWLVAVVPVAAVLLARPRWGIVLLVVGAVTPPIGIGTGTQAEINPAMLLVAGLALLWVMRSLVIGRRLELAPTRVNLPLLGLVLAGVLSLASGQVFGDPAVVLPSNYFEVQLGGVALVLLSALAFWVGANVIERTRDLEIVVGLMIVLGMLAIGNAVLMISRAVPGLTYQFPGVGGLYWMWAPALAYAQILYNRRLTPAVKGLLALTVLAWVWWSWGSVTDFVAGWLPLFIAVLIISWFRSKLLALGLLSLGAIWVIVRSDYYFQRLWLANQGSFNRIELWTTSLGMFGDRQPLLGLGPATYSWYATAYGLYFRQSHSTYVDLFLQYGVLGLVCFLLVFIFILREIWACRNRWPGTFEHGYTIAVFGGICGSLVASVLADWLLPQVYNIGLKGFRHSMFAWLLAGGFVALRRIKREALSEAS